MSGRGIAAGALLALVIAVLVTVVGLVAVTVGATQGSGVLAVILRTVGALGVLVVALLWAPLRLGSERAATFFAAAALAYVLLPLAWTGSALVTQALTTSWVVRFIGDGLVWMLVAVGVTSLQVRRLPRMSREESYADLA